MPAAAVFWWRWLVAASVGVLLFGATMVVLPEPTALFFNLLLFATPGGDPALIVAAPYLRFVYAVLGAVMVGWAVALLCLLYGPFRRGAREGWVAVAISLTAWFVPDTALSLWTGFWPNAVLNAVFAVAFAIPLAATRRAFR